MAIYKKRIAFYSSLQIPDSVNKSIISFDQMIRFCEYLEATYGDSDDEPDLMVQFSQAILYFSEHNRFISDAFEKSEQTSATRALSFYLKIHLERYSRESIPSEIFRADLSDEEKFFYILTYFVSGDLAFFNASQEQGGAQKDFGKEELKADNYWFRMAEIIFKLSGLDGLKDWVEPVSQMSNTDEPADEQTKGGARGLDGQADDGSDSIRSHSVLWTSYFS
ncbi:hypothetical protein ACFL96_20310, partial [Thermoproteota archaeon]